MRHKKRYSFYFIVLLCSILICGCNSKTTNPEKVQADFDLLIKNIFVQEVQSDSITLNYSLSKPENYGITDYEPTLGEYTSESMDESYAISENYLASLEKFDYDSLTKEQQLTYDILHSYLDVGMESSDLTLYQESLSPTIGIQAQLPILLAEYNFYDKQDIEDYLTLLSCVPEYFNEIIVFEQQKSKAGLFMSDDSVDDILKQCNEFTADAENNYLIEVVNDKIASFPGLTKKEINHYQAANRTAVLEKVIPAYESIVKGLTALKGTGKNENGLGGFPKGKEYYEYLVKSSTGSSKSIKQIDSLLDTTIDSSISDMAVIANQYPDILDKIDTISYPYTDPADIITYLKTATTNDFPVLKDVDCTIKYVHDSLEDSLSPAFYLTPPMDNFLENSIYINGGDDYDLSEIFTTLAHEGYPGHLYQTVYYNQNNPVPLRNLLSFGGYTEGWATYAELYSYHIAKLDENVANILEQNLVATLCMYAKVDIGVNYYNWDLTKTNDYLTGFGITNKKDIQAVHASMIEEPANYLKYTLGYLEIMELRNKAEKKLGDSFNAKEFNQFLLDIGPAQFDIINNRLEDWLKR